MDVVCFLQEDRWFGLFASAVADLVPTVEIASVRAPHPCLFGFTTYRHRLLPVIRLEALLSARTASALPDTGLGHPPRRPPSLLIVRDEGLRVGVPSERVGCVLEVNRHNFRSIGRDDSSVGRVVLLHRERRITVLDAARLVRLVHVALGGSACVFDAVDRGARQ